MHERQSRWPGPWCLAGVVCVLAACGGSSSTGRGASCTQPVDDGVACTVDACNGATGLITHSPSSGLCGAGQLCSATAGCQDAPQCAALPRTAGTAVKLQPVVSQGLDAPVHVASPPGDAGRLFVVEQSGRVRLVVNGELRATPYLDITGRVAFGGERGLLSIAFHPSFAANGRFYVNYTDGEGDVRISEFRAADPAAEAADPASEIILAEIPHREHDNHNGGMVAFGPDGYLYASVGDGGGSGNPLRTAQDPASLLGKLLRFDVESPSTPVPGNPNGNAVYDRGLRNPWRFSFDRQTGDLFIGDVGQGDREEIDFKAAAAPGQAPPPGTDWGWSVKEGTLCFPETATCDSSGLTDPVLDYGRAEGLVVIGGHVYRGVSLPDLAATGTYFYADSGSGFVRTFRVVNGQAVDQQDLTTQLRVPVPVSFGEDGCGELYLVDLLGTVSKIVAGP